MPAEMKNDTPIRIGAETDPRWTVDAQGIYNARLASKLSVHQFALLCGWTGQYQSKIENGGVETLSERAMRKILRTFAELGVRVECDLK